MKQEPQSAGQHYENAREKRRKKLQAQHASVPDHTAAISLEDFFAYMPMHSYIYTPCREMWPGASVNARIPPIQIGIDQDGKPVKISVSAWLDKNRPVEQMTWAPGICLEAGRVTPATVADHIQSHHGDYNVFRLGALRSLCAECHNALDDANNPRAPVRADGTPSDSRHPWNHYDSKG